MSDVKNKSTKDDEFEEFRARAYSGGFQTLTRPRYRGIRDTGIFLDDLSGDEHDSCNQKRNFSINSYFIVESEILRHPDHNKWNSESKKPADELKKRTKSKEDSFWGFLEHEMRPRVNSAPTKRPEKLLPFDWHKPKQYFQHSHNELHKNHFQNDNFPTQNNHFVKKICKDIPYPHPSSHWSTNLVNIPLIGLKSSDPRCDWLIQIKEGVVDRRRIVLIGRKGVGKSAIGECFLDDQRIKKNLEIMNKTNLWENQTSFDEEVSCCSLRHKANSMQRQSQPIAEARFTNVTFEHVQTRHCTTPQADLYIVIFSVENRPSYETAVDKLFELKHRRGLPSERSWGQPNRPIILVANKIDLVRTRVVQEKEGRSTADTYGVDEYLEISVAMGHEIDTLIRTTLKILQISFQNECESTSPITTSEEIVDKMRSSSFIIDNIDTAL